MASCPFCGNDPNNDQGVCSYHVNVYEDTWAVSNRIICDWLHRGLEPGRLGPNDREKIEEYGDVA